MPQKHPPARIAVSAFAIRETSVKSNLGGGGKRLWDQPHGVRVEHADAAALLPPQNGYSTAPMTSIFRPTSELISPMSPVKIDGEGEQTTNASLVDSLKRTVSQLGEPSLTDTAATCRSHASAS